MNNSVMKEHDLVLSEYTHSQYVPLWCDKVVYLFRKYEDVKGCTLSICSSMSESNIPEVGWRRLSKKRWREMRIVWEYDEI